MNKKALKICATVFCAVMIAAVSFIVGFFVRGCSKSYGASYEWVLEMIEKNYYFGGVDASFKDTSINAITEKYLDRYSQYYTAAQYKEVQKSNAGSKSGIGISYAYMDGKGAYISSVIGNSPAYISGLRAGEWLKSGKVENGKEVVFNSSSDVQSLFGGAGEGVKINLTSTDGKTYTVAKTEYTASYTYMCTNSTAWIFGDAEEGGLALYEKPSEKIDYLPEGAAYIRLSQFYGTAPKEFVRLVEKFNAAHCTSLILDLRSNGGGFVSVMQQIAGSFADGAKKEAMISRDKHGNEDTFYCEKITDPDRQISKDVTVYVLANGGTASASEALIGALICYGALDYKNIYLSQYSQDYIDWLEGTGQEVKSARSYGKGIMQSTFENRNTGEALKLTTAQIFWPDGKTSIHDRGILLEDGCVASPAEWEHTKGDEELQWIVENIKKPQ